MITFRRKINENSVFLVIEDDLSGSKIRGAFKVSNDKPAIYLTRKHKRIADYELKSDKQAFDWMVDDKNYNEIKKDYKNANEKVIKSFFAYRLTYDGIISYQSKFYQNNNILINLD